MPALRNYEYRFLARLCSEYANEMRDDGFDETDECVYQPEALGIRLLRAQVIDTQLYVEQPVSPWMVAFRRDLVGLFPDGS